MSIATPIDLWDTASGRKLSSLPGAFAPFAFRPDGKVLVGIADDWRRMVAIDLATGRVLWTTPQLPGESGAGRFDFSPDGSTVLAAATATAQSRCVVIATGRRHRPAARRADARPGMRWLLLPTAERSLPAGSRMARRTSMCSTCPRAGGRHPGEPAGRTCHRLLFSPDGRSLFVSDPESRRWLQPEHGFGQIWDPGTGRPTSPLMAGDV